MNSSLEQLQKHETGGRGLWAWLALGYLIFVIYGSLVPLHFHGRALTGEGINRGWPLSRELKP